MFELFRARSVRESYRTQIYYTIVGTLLVAGALSCLLAMPARADATSYVVSDPVPGAFPLVSEDGASVLFVDGSAWPGVIRAATDLRDDVQRVTGVLPDLTGDVGALSGTVVIVGTIGRGGLVDRLVESGKLNVAGVADRWEAFVMETVEHPLPGVQRALVIAGSDKRGTVFGIYELSYAIGVSPWYFWADVPPRQSDELYVRAGRRQQGSPPVKYRGIFLNDENPALLGWVNETFGGFNRHFYETVFELILRMKGNYLWPAMWGKAFADDDPENPRLADEYGVVIATSHHEPLMRAHVEWSRYGEGPWNYTTNADKLREFWREGIERMGDYESVVTIGMRGDGDEPMTQGTAIALLEQIVADQRDIIRDVTGKDPSETPQVWALYKEVQDYYDQGMDVPEDVTLLFADDNWGNIRRLPELGSDRPGGYGVYYHYDYVGGPRNYKWINTNPIARVWEQMHLAYRYGADRIWIVNVGDLKPMEFPIEFFLDYAWNPDEWPAERIPEYAVRWAEKQFGPDHAVEIGDYLTRYTRYNGRRKPELLSPDTYSLTAYREAETVVEDYNRLAEEAEALGALLPEPHQDAYFQLVLFPILASANVNELYYATALNRLYAAQGRATTNAMAERVAALFARDEELTRIYHEDMADGKWVHMMSQTHIGYTYWQEPPVQVMPEVETVDVSSTAGLGVAVEGRRSAWPGAGEPALLPAIDRLGARDRYLEIFNRGSEPFEYSVEAGHPWVKLSESSGRVEWQTRVYVSVDWSAVPRGQHDVPLTVTGAGESVQMTLPVLNPELAAEGFVESDGAVAIEAAHYTRAVNLMPVRWHEIPDFGRTVSGMTTFPVTADAAEPGGETPRLEYTIYLRDDEEVTVHALVSPTLNFHATEGLRLALSVNDQPPRMVNIHEDESLRRWERWVSDNIIVGSAELGRLPAGKHTLKYWYVDPGVVLQKIVVDAGGLEESYLGPPESLYLPAPESP